MFLAELYYFRLYDLTETNLQSYEPYKNNDNGHPKSNKTFLIKFHIKILIMCTATPFKNLYKNNNEKNVKIYTV
jgi:hypothetical protein